MKANSVGGGSDRPLTLAQLRAFVAAAQTESVTKAAALLNVSQPAVSLLLTRLETDLGAQLIVRRGGRFELTDDGNRLLPHAIQTVASADRCQAAVRHERASL